MIDINLHTFSDKLQISRQKDTVYVFDIIRVKNIVLQPEEMVRQLLVHYLIDIGYAKEKIQVEKGLEINGIKRRFDIVVYDKEFQPYILVECKSHKVKLSQATFDQIVQYNMTLSAPYLLVSNGVQTYCCERKKQNEAVKMLKAIPLPE